MSEATSTSTAAPATTAAQPGALNSAPAQPGETGRKSVKPDAIPSYSSARQEAPSSQWSDADEKAFFELAKRSPFKARIKGEERGIDSPESLKELLAHAQRGIGASKVVEQARKEMESARQAREEALAHQQLIQRAAEGDFDARKTLGLVSQQELDARESEWREVPPEVRQLYEERNRYAQELEKMRAESLERAEAEKRQAEERTMQWARRTAVNATQEVAKLLGVNESNAERILPHVAGAIADLRAAGLELGSDMTSDVIVERVKERLGDFSSSMFESLSDERALSVILPRLERLDDAGLQKMLGQKLSRRIARAVAREIAGARGAPQVQRPESNRPESRPPMVIDPMLSRRR